MRAGKLRDRVTFQRQSDESDDHGNVLGEFEDHLTVWGDLRETPGKERIASGTVEATRLATLRVRYSADTAAITAADRVSARGAFWNIRSGPVQVLHAPSELEFTLETGVAT